MNRVRILKSEDRIRLQEYLNSFLLEYNVVDIQFSSCYNIDSKSVEYSAMIVYN